MPGVVETELAVGTHEGRGKRLMPAEVAEAVAKVIAEPRFEVHVPKSLGSLHRLAALLPETGRVRMTRALVPNQVKAADLAARADYERRAVGASGPDAD